MGFYIYKKWFFDILSENENYYIFFLSLIKTGKKYFAFFQIHSAVKNSDGKIYPDIYYETGLSLIKLSEKEIDLKQGKIEFLRGLINMNIKLKDYSIDLSYRMPFQPEYEIKALQIKRTRRTRIEWRPLQVKGVVNGTVSMPDNNSLKFYNSNGYVDLTESNIFPLHIPVYKLLWGRLHHEEIDLTYSFIISSKKSASWSKLYLCHKGSIIEFDNLNLNISEEKKAIKLNFNYPQKYSFRTNKDHYSLTLEIECHEELICNDFMDYAETYGRTAALLLRIFTKDPKGIKFKASANLTLDIGEEPIRLNNIPIINEFVLFKKSLLLN